MHKLRTAVQGPQFTVAAVDRATYLLAANGPEIFATALQLQSIHVENALAEDGAGATTCMNFPPTNQLLNYVYSCCLRFPLDDCIGLSQASQLAHLGGGTSCSTVRLHIATGVRSRC